MGRKTGEKIKNLCIFALPGCLIFCAVVILPFLYGFYLTLTDWDGVSKVKNIIGVQNYISVFKDTAFWSSMGLTLKYVLLSVILVNAVAFLLAYALTNGIKGQKFFRAGFFTPEFDRWCRTWIYLAVRIFKSACEHGKEHRLGIIFHFLVSRSE